MPAEVLSDFGWGPRERTFPGAGAGETGTLAREGRNPRRSRRGVVKSEVRTKVRVTRGADNPREASRPRPGRTRPEAPASLTELPPRRPGWLSAGKLSRASPPSSGDGI